MSTEGRRVSLKTVPQVSSATSSDKKKPKDSKSSKEPKCKRFDLKLNIESEECNEFSLNDLMKSVDKNGEPNDFVDPLDPLATNEDQQALKELAKHFQQKYGGTKKRRQIEDLIDKGMGYDETDPFIDNDEAYDELVPSTLTTKYGGFYINCGELEFRPLSPEKEMEEDDDEEDNIKPVVHIKRKRKIDLISSKKRRTSVDLKAKRSKIPIPNKTVAQMIQQKKSLKPTTSDNSDEIEEIEIDDSESNEAVVSTSVCDVIDSVAKGQDQPNGEPKREANVSNISNGSSDGDDMNKKDLSPNATKLPEGLPEDLIELIDKIKRLAQTTHDGKKNFFNDEVNHLLYEIERRCKSLAMISKTQVFTHLAAHLPCSKQTLVSRAKKASTEAFDYELQTALTQIRIIIARLQPFVFANHQRQMQEAQKLMEVSRQQGITIQDSSKIPRKIFVFNGDLKKQLDNAVNAKLNLYDQMGSKGHSVQLKDYLIEFLDKEIKVIFPKGWMTLEHLKNKVKWINKILPAEPKQLPHSSSQSAAVPQTSGQPVQPSVSSNQTPTSSQSQANKVQTSQSLSAERTNKREVDSSDSKVTPNSRVVSNSYYKFDKVNDNLTEGLVGKIMSSSKDTSKNRPNTPEAMNLTSLDLSTKARSSPNLSSFNTPTSSKSSMTPINLKTSPSNVAVVKPSPSPSSPSISPMSMNSILGNYKSEKAEKLSHEACLTKVIEQSLGDYPNSSVSSTSNQRNTKSVSLPQTSHPFSKESFAKSFNSAPKPEPKDPEVIEIASSPEPYTQPSAKPQPTVAVKQATAHSSSQQSAQPKSQSSQQKASISSSTLNYHRNSDIPKKRYSSSGATSLLHSTSSAQRDPQELRAKVDQLMQQMSQSTPSRVDSSLNISPIASKANDSMVSSSGGQSRQSSSQNTARHQSSASAVITSSVTTPTYQLRPDQDNSAYMSQYLRYLNENNIIHNNAVNLFQNQIRYMDSTALFQSPNGQNIFYPFVTNSATNSHRSGGKDK